MKTATGHGEEIPKLYVVQYTIGEKTVEIKHQVGHNTEKVYSQIIEEERNKGKSHLFRPRISSIKEVTHPDYNINLERKIK